VVMCWVPQTICGACAKAFLAEYVCVVCVCDDVCVCMSVCVMCVCLMCVW